MFRHKNLLAAYSRATRYRIRSKLASSSEDSSSARNSSTSSDEDEFSIDSDSSTENSDIVNYGKNQL